MSTRQRVLLCTEGTYPYVGGGVSTWCEILCRNSPDIDFTIFAVTGNPEVEFKYELSANTGSVMHVPLWGMREPAEFPLSHQSFQVFRQNKRLTTDAVIAEQFVPHLLTLLRAMDTDAVQARDIGLALWEMWRYFAGHDWNETWKSRETWDAFLRQVSPRYLHCDPGVAPQERPSLHDLTTALRWTYNFLMPLVAPIPEVDIVHSTIAGFAALPGIVAKIERGTPFLLTEHGVYIRERYIAVSSTEEFSFFAKRYLLQLTAVVAKASYYYADVVAPVASFNQRWEKRYGADPDRIQTIYNGVDPQVFMPKDKPAEFQGVPVVVAAARVFPLKDIETMIRSAAVARSSIPDVQYLVYGSLDADPPYVAKCRQLIEDLELDRTFHFAGFHASPAELFNCGDISVLSSISEGFPYTVLESMSCARPVVATDVGGVREALEGFGLVVPPMDHIALGEAAVELLVDDERRLELGRRAREQVLAHYRVSQSVGAYHEVYARLGSRISTPSSSSSPAA